MRIPCRCSVPMFIVCLIVDTEPMVASPPSVDTQLASKPLCETANRNSFNTLRFLPKGDCVILGGGSGFGPGEFAICSTTTLEKKLVRKDHKLAIHSLAISPDGSKLATGGGYGELKIYDVESGNVLANLDAGGEYTHSLAFSSDGRLLANGAGGAVTLWDMTSIKKVACVPAVETAPHGLAFSPGDKLLCFGDLTGVRLWDVAKRQESFRIPCKDVCALLFTPDGKYLIVAGGGDDWSVIQVWDLEKKKKVRCFVGHRLNVEGTKRAVLTLALTKEGNYLVSGGGDETVRIWEFATGRELVCLAGNKAIVRSVAISSESKYLAMSSDELVRIWDLQKLIENAQKATGKAEQPK